MEGAQKKSPAAAKTEGLATGPIGPRFRIFWGAASVDSFLFFFVHQAGATAMHRDGAILICREAVALLASPRLSLRGEGGGVRSSFVCVVRLSKVTFGLAQEAQHRQRESACW